MEPGGLQLAILPSIMDPDSHGASDVSYPKSKQPATPQWVTELLRDCLSPKSHLAFARDLTLCNLRCQKGHINGCPPMNQYQAQVDQMHMRTEAFKNDTGCHGQVYIQK